MLLLMIARVRDYVLEKPATPPATREDGEVVHYEPAPAVQFHPRNPRNPR